MGNIVRRLFRRKEDYASALVQIAEEIEQGDSALKSYHSRWRAFLYRITYVAVILELAYAIYWYFLTPPNAPPIDTAIHILILASIPPLWYLLVLLIGAYYRYRISSTEESLQEKKVESQKKLELFKENGTFKEVSTLMAQLEARTPRRGPAGGMRPGDGKSAAGRAQAPSTEPRSKRTGSTQPVQGDQANVKVAPSTVAVKRTNRGDKGETHPSEAPIVRQIASDPMLASNNDLAEPLAGKDGEELSRRGGSNASHSTSLSTSSVPSSSALAPANPGAQASNAGSQQQHRLHLNPVPQSPYRQQFVANARHSFSSEDNVSSQQQESKGWMDWFVDKLVGSEATTPKWCAFCGAHNGLIPVDELQNARFVCHNCKGYNSPEVIQQLKSVKSSSSSPPSTSSAASPVDASASEDTKSEESVVRHEKSKPKRRRRLSSGSQKESEMNASENKNSSQDGAKDQDESS